MNYLPKMEGSCVSCVLEVLYVIEEDVKMKDKTKFWKVAILSVILVSFAGLITYKVIAGTLGTASLCPATAACPSTINCPPQADVNKACPVEGAADKEACKLRAEDGAKKVCPHSGQCDKKPDCDPAKKQCGL